VYASRVTLTARADSASVFDRWLNVCATNPECTFSIGAVTHIGAVFSQATTTPPSPVSQPPPPGPPAPLRPPKQQTTRAFSARLAQTRVIGRGKTRRIVVRVASSRAASARLRLIRARRDVAARTVRLAAGVNVLRLKVPARAKSGRYRLLIVVRAQNAKQRSFSRVVRVPR
jgi:hypothetical protein